MRRPAAVIFVPFAASTLLIFKALFVLENVADNAQANMYLPDGSESVGLTSVISKYSVGTLESTNRFKMLPFPLFSDALPAH